MTFAISIVVENRIFHSGTSAPTVKAKEAIADDCAVANVRATICTIDSTPAELLRVKSKVAADYTASDNRTV